MAKTEITFTPRATGDGVYLAFALQGGSRCQAGGAGNLGIGRQEMTCGVTDNWDIYAHELSHTIGFLHEHQRPDRGRHITFANPLPSPNQDKDPETFEPLMVYPLEPGKNEMFGPYDCNSVTSYRTVDGLRALPGGCNTFGTNGGASLGDIDSVRAAYGFTPSAGLLHQQSAISRGPNSLDVFARWANHFVHTATWQGKWQGWWKVDAEPKTTEAVIEQAGRGASPPTAISRTPDTIDLFLRGHNDYVYTARWTGSGWTPWEKVNSDKSLSAVAAVSRTSNSIDLFIRGLDSGIYTTRWSSASGWDPWTRIRNGLGTSDVTVASPSDTEMSVFVRGVNGGIYSSWWRPGTDWAEWQRIGDDVALLGTTVAAVARTPTVIDLFMVGVDRGVYTAWSHDAGQTWSGWSRISDHVVAPGTTVSAVSRTQENLDVYVIGTDRRVWTATWDGTGSAGWEGFTPVMDFRLAHRSGISAVSRDPNIVDLFAIGEDGGTWTAAMHTDKWLGWWPVKEHAG
jgi:hypothetical protein